MKKKSDTNNFSYLSETRINKLIFLIVVVLVALLVLDTSLVRIYSYASNNQSLSNTRIGLFLAILIAYVIGQYLLLEFVKRKSREIRTKQQLHIKMIHRIVTIAQYVLTALLVVISSEMIVTSTYSILLVAVVIGISYTLAMVMLGLLAQRFFSWFKSNRNLVVLLYGLSAAMLAINAAFTFSFVEVILMDTMPYVQSYVGSFANSLYCPWLVSRYTELSIHTNHCSIVHDIVGSNHRNPKALFFKIEKNQVWDYS